MKSNPVLSVNMKRLNVFILLFLSLAANTLMAQDTLPKFTVKNAGNSRIIVGWVNTYTNVRQISIQRSHDSLTGYKTILTVPDPSSPQNGFVDTKAPSEYMYYRIYILLEKGVYLFSEAKKPVKDSVIRSGVFRPDFVPGIDSVKSPVVNNTKPQSNTFMPSMYVYTNRDGYVRVTLPLDEKPKKYSIKFFDSDETLLFELKEIKERDFKIDKANFYHAGWFRFELYEDGKLIEKHKFHLEKDF